MVMRLQKSTGFSDLDDLTSGLQPADLVIVCGPLRPWVRPPLP
jgi:replicative DNA helicase